MRFMIMVRANATSEAGDMSLVDEGLMADMAAFHEEMAAAGVLLDGNGLKPSREGFRVSYQDGKPTVVDGPFAEAKEMIAGYTMIQVRSRDEALAWARRFPAPFGKRGNGGEIEVRPVYELEDFNDADSVRRFRDLPGNGNT